MNEPGRLHDNVKQNEREIRRLRLDMDSIASGGVVRGTSIGSVIPGEYRPVAWWFNANLLGLGDELELLEGEGVWISGSFVDGRAYYHIGAYCAPPCGGAGGLSGIDFLLNDGWFCWGQVLNLIEGWGVWISGTCVGDEASYLIGAYGAAGITGTVDWYVNGLALCEGLEADLQEEEGVWISGECVGGRAIYHIGAYGNGGGAGDDILALAYAVAF